MSKYVSLAALALALVACVLIINERNNRETAIRRALQQREAAMVQRYAPMLQRMLEELDGGTGSITIRNMDEGLQSLAGAIEKLAERRRREQAALPAPDAPVQELFSIEPAPDQLSPSSPQSRYREAQRLKGFAPAAHSSVPRKTNDRARAASAEPSLIAVALHENGKSHIGLINTNGGVVRRLTNGSFDQLPSWSADGTRLAYISAGDGDGRTTLNVMDWQGNDQHQVTDIAENVRMSAWSPDGARILFTTQESTGIYVVDAEGREKAKLLVRSGSMPEWSPDGKQIAYNLASQIWIARSDGTQSHPLFHDGTPRDHVQALFYPRWSPDGKSMLFTSVETRRPRYAHEVQLDVYVAGLKDLQPAPVAPSDGVDVALDWSPDGQQILFFSDRNSDAGLYVMNANGSGVRKIIKSESLFGNWGAWRPSPAMRVASKDQN